MKKILILWLFFLFVYLFVSGKGTFHWETTAKNYWSLQVRSFLDGHINLTLLPKDTYDLSIFKGKSYLYWPPLPAIFVLPFVLIWGIKASDIFYTAFWASFPPVLLYMVLEKARKSRIIPDLSDRIIFLLTLFFAFGTVYFYLSVLGTVWFTSQITTMIVFLLSLYFLFSGNFLISIFFFCLSFWGRTILVIALPLYLFFLFQKRNNHDMPKIVVKGSAMVVISILLFGLYNYLRFGNPMENGLALQNFNSRWLSDIKSYGLMNIRYLPHNFEYLFLKPIGISAEFPFIVANPEGNSIFATSPLFFALFSLFTIRKLKKNHKNLFVFLFTSFIIMMPQLVYYGTGWFQFGYRYSLDFLPLWILSLAFTVDLLPQNLFYLLFGVSIIINTLAVFLMQSAAPYLYY